MPSTTGDVGFPHVFMLITQRYPSLLRYSFDELPLLATTQTLALQLVHGMPFETPPNFPGGTPIFQGLCRSQRKRTTKHHAVNQR